MTNKKIYSVNSVHHGRTTTFTGTLEELETNVFGYTLECGHSWNNKIPRYPKTITSLITALTKSAEECRRYYDYYELA